MAILLDVDVLLATLCFVSFVWAVSGHFRREGRMPLGMRLTSILSLLGFCWWFYARLMDIVSGREPGIAGRIAASLLFVVSFTVFWWSVRATRRRPLTLAFALDPPEFLQDSGPYAYVRHPFYLSYCLFWVGTAMAAQTFGHAAVALVMVALYIEAARREETKFERSPLAGSYGDYRRHAGLLLPRFWR